MSATSLLLQQHIGTVQLWIQNLTDNPAYINLQERGCHIHNGVIVTHPDYDLKLTPFGLKSDLRHVRWRSGLIWILYDYLKLINPQPEIMVQYAYELDSSIAELEYLLVREQFYPGGKLWWRNNNGIWEIDITHVSGYVNPKLDFKIDITKTTHTCHANKMALFSSKALALDPRKEGRYDFR